MECLLIGGEAEEGRLKRLAHQAHPRIMVADQWPLVELAARMRACTGFVGHDSGVTHLAAAVDLPGLALWGETNETVWRPRSERMQVVRHPGGLSGLPVEDVFGKLAASGLL